MSELKSNSPVLENESSFHFILGRHGQYNADLQTAEETWGYLTNQGINDSKLKARTLISELSVEFPHLCLGFVHSPTRFLGKYGDRAAQTSKISLEEIGHQLPTIAGNVNLIAGSRGPVNYTQGLLRESNVSGEYLKRLENDYGDKAWEHYYNGETRYEALRIENRIESPQDVANRVFELIEMLRRYSQINDLQRPEVTLVFWAFTHADVLRCFEQYGLDKGDSIRDKKYSYNHTIQMAVLKNGNIQPTS